MDLEEALPWKLKYPPPLASPTFAMSAAPKAPGAHPKRKSVQYPPPSPSGRASRSGSEAGDLGDLADVTPSHTLAANPQQPTITSQAPPPPSEPTKATPATQKPVTEEATVAPPPLRRGGAAAKREASPVVAQNTKPQPVPSTTQPQAAAAVVAPASAVDPAPQAAPIGGPGGPRRVVTVRPAMSSVSGVDRFAVIPRLQGGADRLKERVSSSLHNLLRDRCPERLDRHEAILDNYAGKERELLEFMMTLFGDEILAGPRPDISLIMNQSNDRSIGGDTSSPHKPRPLVGTNTTAMLDDESSPVPYHQYGGAGASHHFGVGTSFNDSHAAMESLSRISAGRASNVVGGGRTCLVTPPVPKDLIPVTPTSTSRYGPN